MLESIRLPLNHHCTFPFILYTCISPFYTIFSPYCINWNIVGKVILQTQPKWIHEREVMLAILPYRLLTLLQYSIRIEDYENKCVRPVDILHTKFLISPLLIPNLVWSPVTQPWLIRSQIYRELNIFNAVIMPSCEITSNAWTFTWDYYVWRSNM